MPVRYHITRPVSTSSGVMDAGAKDNCEELLQAAWPWGPAVCFWRSASNHGNHHPAPPDYRSRHRPPCALTDRGTDHQQPRRNSLPHPGTYIRHFQNWIEGCVMTSGLSGSKQQPVFQMFSLFRLSFAVCLNPYRWAQATRLPPWQMPQSCPGWQWHRSTTPLWLMERYKMQRHAHQHALLNALYPHICTPWLHL